MRVVLFMSSLLLVFAILTGCGPITQVTVIPNLTTLRPGETRQFEAYAYDRTGNPKPGVPITWSSSSPEIATVDATGRVCARRPGRVRITAVFEGKIPGSATVIVAGEPVEGAQAAPPPPPTPVSHAGISRAVASVSVFPQTIVVAVDAIQPFSAVAYDAAGEPVGGADFVWTSSDSKIAAVNVNGEVRGVAPGTARILASEAGKVGYAVVTVTQEGVPAPPAPGTPPPPAPPVSPGPRQPGQAAQPTAPTPQPAQPAQLTYSTGPAATRVKPIIDQRCASCHRPGGAGARIPLTNYAEVKASVNNGSFVRSLHGSMAPYAGPYRDQLIRWAEQGAPQ